jgi:hypothetical protein
VATQEVAAVTALATRLGTDLLMAAFLGEVMFTIDDDVLDEHGYVKVGIDGTRWMPPAIAEGLRDLLGVEATSWSHSLSVSGHSCSCGWAGDDGQEHMREAIRG